MASWVLSCLGGPHAGQWPVSGGPPQYLVPREGGGRYELEQATAPDVYPGHAIYTWHATGQCKHLIPVFTCADCKPQANRNLRTVIQASYAEPEPDTSVSIDWERASQDAEGALSQDTGPWIMAEHYGRCKACGERTEPGDMIAFSDEDDGWISTCCFPG